MHRIPSDHLDNHVDLHLFDNKMEKVAPFETAFTQTHGCFDHRQLSFVFIYALVRYLRERLQDVKQ